MPLAPKCCGARHPKHIVTFLRQRCRRRVAHILPNSTYPVPAGCSLPPSIGSGPRVVCLYTQYVLLGRAYKGQLYAQFWGDRKSNLRSMQMSNFTVSLAKCIVCRSLVSLLPSVSSFFRPFAPCPLCMYVVFLPFSISSIRRPRPSVRPLSDFQLPPSELPTPVRSPSRLSAPSPLY